MDVRAKAKYIRISSKKMRLVADIVRGMEVNKALSQLNFVNKKSAKPIKKLVESAIANAKHNYNLDKNNLFIKEIRIDKGRTLHRWTPRALGRATPIRKRSSHISLILGELVDSGVVKSKKQEVAAPVSLEEMAKGKTGESKENRKKENKKTSRSTAENTEKNGKTEASKRKSVENPKEQKNQEESK